MTRLTVAIQRLPHNADLPVPQAASELAAGLDLQACLSSPVTLDPGGRAIIPTGFAIALPAGFEAQVRPRSGLAAKSGVTVLNAPGTIDADYRGEVGVILINHGDQPFVVDHGMRIAQMVIAPVPSVILELTNALPTTQRGAGGFGSTGA